MSEKRFELSPTTRFADRATDYALFRPSYPKTAIDAALAGLSSDPVPIMADIGAGTGISARLFADRGLSVLAVEPNAAMRESAEPHRNVTFINGAAEATGLASKSVDLVLCAQAFHWFRPQEALAEFSRIVKPGGRLVFFVNERNNDEAAMSLYNAAIRVASERELSEGMRASVDDALAAAGFTVAPKAFPNTQRLTKEGLIGRARSASYVPKEGPRYEQLLRDLAELWEHHRDADGLVTLGYHTFVWIVEEAHRPRFDESARG